MMSQQMPQKEPHSIVQSPTPYLFGGVVGGSSANHLVMTPQLNQQYNYPQGSALFQDGNTSPGKMINSPSHQQPFANKVGQQQSTTSQVSSPQRAQQMASKKQAIIHETFSIPNLERKMMFLNEPSFQNSSGQPVDQIRHIWRVHYNQMQNMRKPSERSELDEQQQQIDANQACSLDEIAGQSGFSAINQRPKDFNLFQTSVRNQLAELNRAHSDLRTRFKTSGQEVEQDIERIQGLTGHIQRVFNDFILSFNSFVQREERLETLHHQAIKKSKELSKKIQLEVLAQSSQRSQLLAIVDDLTEQLKHNKATTVKTEALEAESGSHGQTKQILEQKERRISEMEKEIKGLHASLQQMGQIGVQHKAQSQRQDQQIQHLEGVIQDRDVEIDDLITRRGQLEEEVARLKSQVELTQSSKDKIILKLKQEMRLQAHQTSMINATLANNTSAMYGGGQTTQNNISASMQLTQSAANNLGIGAQHQSQYR